ncbi:MAG: NUDIX hydrolase [Weeksellaceae bacterium]
MITHDKLLNVSVDCVIFGYQDNQLYVLLIEQEKLKENHMPLSALPGDHIITGEDLDTAANRVLKGLTGIDGVYLKQFKAFGNPDRTKKEKDRIWLYKVRENPEEQVITIGYYALIQMDKTNLTPSSFAKRAYWINVKEIPNLAFDHNEICNEALQQLRKDAESFYISCELLPEKFTLTQLQSLYEAILDKKLDKRNFRKNAKKMKALICLNEKQKGVSHKPALLYTIESKEV